MAQEVECSIQEGIFLMSCSPTQVKNYGHDRLRVAEADDPMFPARALVVFQEPQKVLTLHELAARTVVNTAAHTVRQGDSVMVQNTRMY